MSATQTILDCGHPPTPDHGCGTVHVYRVEAVSRTTAYVEYTNPTEYGTPQPMTAVLPLYWQDDTPHVVFHILRVIRDNWNGEGWQAFTALLDCPVLWRSAPDATDWRTEDEIKIKAVKA